MRSVAVLLLHAYTFPRHEAAVRDLCRDMGFTQARRGQIFAVKLMVKMG